MRKRSLLTALAVSAAMIVAACGGGSGSTSNTLLFGDYQDVDNLGPYGNTVMRANVLCT
jgi:ABC-type oligopeptide transport system substrate-binding subunit